MRLSEVLKVSPYGPSPSLLAADTATFSAAMKTKFIGPIRDNLHNGKVLLFGDPDANPTDFKGIMRSAEGIDHVGNEFRIPMKAKRNQSVGFRSENETLPAPGNSSYTYLQEPMRHAYALFNITGQLMRASESSEGAFKAAFKVEMEDTVLSSKLDMNRAAYGDGTGVLTTIRANEAAAQTVIDVTSTINFRGGEIIDGVTIATGVVIEPAREVISVDRTNRTITVSPALTTGLTATTDGWVRASSDSTVAVPNNSWNKEIQGLASIVAATGTLHGISPVTYAFWKSYVDSTAGAISDAKFRAALSGSRFESGLDNEGAMDFIMITTRGIRDNYATTLTSLKRFTNAESMTLRGGFDALLFDSHPIFTDDQCPVSTLYGLSLKKLFWSQMSDWNWMEEDGKVLKWESRRDRYIAVLYKYCQMGTTQRNAHFKMTALTDDVR
jgi:hypothetical protein